MNLIDSNDILKASKLDRFGGNLGGSLVAKLVMYIMRLNKINKLYSDVYSDNPEAFLDRLIEALGVTIEVNEEDLQKIPKEYRAETYIRLLADNDARRRTCRAEDLCLG